MTRKAADERGGPAARVGIQSIEVGIPIIGVLAKAGGALSLSALASEAGMTPSKAHKYLVSFQRCGLVEQNPEGKYDVGVMALELGYSALRRMDIIKLASPIMGELRDQVGETIVLTTFMAGSVVVVAAIEYDRPIGVSVKVGSRLPLFDSSNGQIFLANMGRGELDVAAKRDGRPNIEYEKMLDEIRERGIAVSENHVLPGVVGISAPVFGLNGICAAITIAAIAGRFDTSDENEAVRALRRSAHNLSRLLGGEAKSSYDQ